jgi:arabinogalactan oligomer/maltooligosaccharide transport system substrate-binding protein
MYYNKSMFSADDIKSLDTMLSKGKVAFDLGNGWYNGAFFFGAGGTLFGDKGIDAAAGVDYKGATGAAVAKKMAEMFATGNFVNGGNGADVTLFQEKQVGAIFTGSWNYNTLKDALGDDLGLAVLPTFTVEGQTYTMKSFAGSKAVGVNAQISDPINASVATQVAAFLASKESQEARFNLRGISPTHVELAASDAVKNHPVVSTEVAVMNTCAVLQPVISEMGKYWTPMGNFGGGIISGAVDVNNAGDMLGQTLDQING